MQGGEVVARSREGLSLSPPPTEGTRAFSPRPAHQQTVCPAVNKVAGPSRSFQSENTRLFARFQTSQRYKPVLLQSNHTNLTDHEPYTVAPPSVLTATVIAYVLPRAAPFQARASPATPGPSRYGRYCSCRATDPSMRN